MMIDETRAATYSGIGAWMLAARYGTMVRVVNTVMRVMSTHRVRSGSVGRPSSTVGLSTSSIPGIDNCSSEDRFTPRRPNRARTEDVARPEDPLAGDSCWSVLPCSRGALGWPGGRECDSREHVAASSLLGEDPVRSAGSAEPLVWSIRLVAMDSSLCGPWKVAGRRAGTARPASWGPVRHTLFDAPRAWAPAPLDSEGR